MNEIKEALNRIETRLDSMDRTSVKQEENLKEHMRRTEILEREFKPVKSHVEQVRGAYKLLALLSLIVGISATIYKVFNG